jgi:BioD-like phosphotransacetylase family protein
MSNIYISSTGDHAGQSLIAWTIARRLLERGINPGFFKPFGTGRIQVDDTWTDPDAFLFKKLLNIKEPLEMICPYADSESAEKEHKPRDVLSGIVRSEELFRSERDVLIIMGSKHIFFDETLNALPDISVMAEVNANLILVHKYQKFSATLYSILSVHSLLREKVKGIIINRVPLDKIDEVKRQLIPALHDKGIMNISFIPEDPALNFRRVGEVCNTLNGKIATGEGLLNNPVERMSVGGASLQGDLSIFKRVYNKIILLGPCNECGVAGIIMTGNREPGEQLLDAVKKANVPLIIVKEDSLDALERLESTLPALSTEDENKAVRFTEFMDQSGSLDRLIDSLVKLS